MFFVILFLIFVSITTYPIPSIRIWGQPLSMFLVFALLFYGAKIRIYRRLLPKTVFPLVLIILGILISSAFSQKINTDFIINLLAYYLIVFSMANIGNTLNDRGTLRDLASSLLYVVIIAGTLLCIYGYYGYITGNIGDEANAFWWMERRYWGLHYTTSTRNADVHYVAISFIAVLTIEHKKKIHWVLVFFLLSAVVLSMARNAWISILIVFVVFLMNREGVKKKLKVLAFGTVGIICVLYIVSLFGMSNWFLLQLLSIIDSSISSSNHERWLLIKETINIIIHHPFGVGAEQLGYYYQKVGLFRFNHAENTYLNITAELGFIALIPYLMLLLTPLFIALKRKDKRTKDLFVICSTTYLIISLLFNTETLNCYIWIVLGINWFFSYYRRRVLL